MSSVLLAESVRPSLFHAMADQSPPPSATVVLPPKTYELTACSIYYAKSTSSTLHRLLHPFSTFSPPNYILNNVSLTARPGELLAVVGPSGAGKSTLLDILAACTAPTHGSLLLNNSPLPPSTFRRLSAHVPQHDTHLPHLTVSETFAFAAHLLGSSDAVPDLLHSLRLSHLVHTRLSAALSGGERRRVSIGLALLHDPAVLILDEPTSGLDSSSASNILHLLRSIAAARGRTIVLSIHQPTSTLLSLIDSLLLLSSGFVLHHGSLSSLHGHLLSCNLTVPSQLNSLEFAMENLDLFPHPPTTKPTNPTPTYPNVCIRYRSSRAGEILTLYSRHFKIIYRSKQLLLTNTLEALAVGLLLGSIYHHVGYDKHGIQKRLGFFAFTLTFLLSFTTETLPIFVADRPILLREATSGLYRLSSHLAANTLIFLPYLFIVALIYSCSVYFLVGLCAKWPEFVCFVLVVWATVMTANSFVMMVSAVAPDYIAGTAAVVAALAGFFLFSGYFIGKESMPVYWVFLHYLSPYKYALDALLANEYGCESRRCFGWGEEGGCVVTGREVMERRGLRVGESWANLRVLFGFFGFYRLMYWVVLTRRISRLKK